MHRTQIQLDEATYDAVRRRAFEEGASLSAVVRKLLAEALGVTPGHPTQRIEDFTFVGVGRSRQGDHAPVSERHDEALAASQRARKRR